MTELAVQGVIATLEASPKSIRCDELAKLLEDLGFDVRKGRQGGHRVFFHDDLSDFISGSYDCGHGKNPEIKPAYIRKVVRILKEHETELTEILRSSGI